MVGNSPRRIYVKPRSNSNLDLAMAPRRVAATVPRSCHDHPWVESPREIQGNGRLAKLPIAASVSSVPLLFAARDLTGTLAQGIGTRADKMRILCIYRIQPTHRSTESYAKMMTGYRCRTKGMIRLFFGWPNGYSTVTPTIGSAHSTLIVSETGSNAVSNAGGSCSGSAGG